MFISGIDALIKDSNEKDKPVWQLMMEYESDSTGATIEEIYDRVAEIYKVMKAAIKNGIDADIKSVSGLSGGDAKKYNHQIEKDGSLLSHFQSKAIAYALATSEHNASMGVIAAAPTAGASGILPGVLVAAQEEFGFDDDTAVKALLTASAIGTVIAIRATISGAQGGCQAECGAGAAMAAAAVIYVTGGTFEECANAATLALKNCLGLVCDPVAGLVEVPCVKRNGMFASIAITAADMTRSGIKSFIPPDEVIDAMYQIGITIPPSLRETAKGGLAVTPTGKAASKRMHSL
ncbi:MAG: L-serine ammonia-lyase, iron-sulfur-dependent, subunit alpha [Clostridia bacterium]|nr:L-serine ammonia-lyase, iron-sulfur-dependent, subunit alpha [Oscillospiraceae bacterium]MBQ2911996.1 L-serine ammonia-lyase, iron-sulfur-dependent, subunit alpha [Clostridia bacterium]MBQ6868472.1 L-serine ammonia-lyase, iron-sulfur-dependent, subunit alpha [Clostridia bacterium]MBQ7093113.1 L-serine ammonia-lyase, iron-sulfur-dependent, subunit alpha [Clostridia bacterium]